MFKKILSSFLLAFHNIRSHFFHTFLSVLGIIIGVAALVSILSLIDGMEQYAKEQIARTTSLNAIVIQSQSFRTANGIRVKKDSFDVIRYEDYVDLKRTLTKPAKVNYMTSFASSGKLESDSTSIVVMAYGLGSSMDSSRVKFIAGREFTEAEIANASPTAAVNLEFVKVLDSTMRPNDIIGKKFSLKYKSMTISAVVDDKQNQPHIAFPATLLTPEELHSLPPTIVIDADVVLDVAALKAEANEWIRKKYSDPSDFNVVSNDARVAQAEKGFTLFRLIMGLIVGISVVVGGIGIMNVLLISITERTVEIGIRKAVGANRRDIILQFLAESITVSVFGSTMGLILGVLGTMAVVPVVTMLTEIPFYANYTVNTLLVVSILAIALGIIFGTYPAIRASRLDPVEAIRHE